MRCAHEGCRCDMAEDRRYCNEYCEEHGDHLAGIEDHACECGHAACQAA